MRLYNKPFRVVDGDDFTHAAFEIEGTVISFESNPFAQDPDTMVVWNSKEEYLEEMGVQDEE